MSSLEKFIQETSEAMEASITHVTTTEQMEIEQIEKEARWLVKRVGKFTASNIPKLMTKGRGKEWGDTSMTEILSVLWERLTGDQRETISTFAMRWGDENEYPAFLEYKERFNDRAVYGKEGDDILFIEPMPCFGLSPDAITYREDGTIEGITEIKCPENGVNHLKYCLIEKIEKGDDYFYQMIAQFLSGCDWIDFVSFDPRIEGEYRMHRVRMNRMDYLEDIEEVRQRVMAADQLIEGNVLPKIK